MLRLSRANSELNQRGVGAPHPVARLGTYRCAGDCKAGPRIPEGPVSVNVSGQNDEIFCSPSNPPPAERGGRRLAGFCSAGESGGSCCIGEKRQAFDPTGCSRLLAAGLAPFRDLLPAQQREWKPDQRSSPDCGTFLFCNEPEPLKRLPAAKLRRRSMITFARTPSRRIPSHRPARATGAGRARQPALAPRSRAPATAPPPARQIT